MPVISLLTDFGEEDVFVGTMKGVILGIAPGASLVDLCHGVPPQDVMEGAWLLGISYSYFPAGTIHLAVVDPGVGTSRRAMALRAGGYTFVGPDNGLFTQVLEREGEFQAVALVNPKYQLHHVSRTFHGRDVFAPAAAHLAAGVPLEELGEPITDPVRLAIPEPEEMPDGLRLKIMRIDRFGNLITNLTEERYEQWMADNPGRSVAVDIGRRRVLGIRSAYSEVTPGSLLAIFGSSGRLEIAANGASARDELKVGKEAPVMICFADAEWGRGY